jgi:hypothetical protein
VLLAREGEHIAPAHEQTSYHCPYCGVLAPMYWIQLQYHRPHPTGSGGYRPAEAWMVQCGVCHELQFWVKGDNGQPHMVRPVVSGSQRPHPQMPEDARRDYEEARSILRLSPRGACALLRLATQKLVDGFVPGSDNLNNKIGTMVGQGLPDEVQHALDSLRVVGNHAVHPGELAPLGG